MKFGSLNSDYEVGYVTPHLLYVVLSMKATGKHTVGVCYCDMHADRTRLAHNVCTERRLTSHFCVVRELIDDFPCDVTRMRKFDYYSADHTLGGSQHS